MSGVSSPRGSGVSSNATARPPGRSTRRISARQRGRSAFGQLLAGPGDALIDGTEEVDAVTNGLVGDAFELFRRQHAGGLRNYVHAVVKAIEETNRRRAIQVAYNTEHGITPTTIKKAIHDITDQLRSEHDKAVNELVKIDEELARTNPKQLMKQKEQQMMEAVQALDFETAALIREGSSASCWRCSGWVARKA